jgi:hypothetical protein
MKLSTANAFCDEPTERQNITGTCVFFITASTLSASLRYGVLARPSTAEGSMPSPLAQPSEREIDPTAVRKSSAIGMPSGLSAAFIAIAACGR